jgi:hypothetical protein
MRSISIAFVCLILFLTACGKDMPDQPPEPEVTLEDLEVPSEQEAPSEETASQESGMPAEEPDNFIQKEYSAGDAAAIEYGNTGFVSELSCDFAMSRLSFTFTNTLDHEVQIWNGNLPTPENVVKISVNGRQFNSPKTETTLNCGSPVFKAGESAPCVGDLVIFRGKVGYNQEGKNKLFSQAVGARDLTLFECNS